MARSLRPLSRSDLTAAPTPRSILASRVKARRCHHLSQQRQPSFACDPVSNHAEKASLVVEGASYRAVAEKVLEAVLKGGNVAEPDDGFRFSTRACADIDPKVLD